MEVGQDPPHLRRATIHSLCLCLCLSVSLTLSSYICVYMCIYICIRMYIYIYIFIYTYMRARTFVRVFIYIYTHVYTHARTCTTTHFPECKAAGLLPCRRLAAGAEAVPSPFVTLLRLTLTLLSPSLAVLPSHRCPSLSFAFSVLPSPSPLLPLLSFPSPSHPFRSALRPLAAPDRCRFCDGRAVQARSRGPPRRESEGPEGLGGRRPFSPAARGVRLPA